MLRTDLKSRIQKLQKNRPQIRNICILAHVDHGKTTLADSLIASNGIISQRQAGKLRYLDNREDEQLRGITMKSSAIALQFVKRDEEYLINLIDSPGHVDFSSEVSTAVRLCDGAIVVVDAVEGVCPQTQAVLQQAWVEGIKPCLVINKIDRLISELRQTPTEAYYHLQQILEQVNAVMGSLFTSEVMQAAATKADKQRTTDHADDQVVSDKKEEEAVLYDWSAGFEDTDDSSLYFSPEHGNVIFASAIDGWGFGVSHFAELYAKKLGIRADILQKTLWGDYYLNTKSKRILRGAQAKAKKPFFVQFVLENIWAVYDAVLVLRDKARIDKIVSSMGLKISARDSRHTDPRIHLYAICSQWLPLAVATLGMVVDHLPTPLQLSPERVERLMCGSAKTFDSFPTPTQLLEDDFLSCSPDSSSPVIVFVSKLFAVDSSVLPQNRSRPLTHEEIAQRREEVRQKHLAKSSVEAEAAETKDETLGDAGTSEQTGDAAGAPDEEVKEEKEDSVIFLAFSRVFSGTIRKGQKLFVLQPRYDPREVDVDGSSGLGRGSDGDLPMYVSEFTVEELFILMGREVMPVGEVPAGNVLGIAGLEDHILKSATISSTLACPAFRPMSFIAAPIVRVAVEPVYASDMPALIRGMKLLNQADPCVEVFVQETGEHVLSTVGEVHLQRCINDLKGQFARVELNVSSPIVPFRETIIPPPKVDMVNEVISSENEIKAASSSVLKETTAESLVEGTISIHTANKGCRLEIEALPLPLEVTTLLEKSAHLLRALNLLNSKVEVKLNEETIAKLRELKTELHTAFTSSSDTSCVWQNAIDCVWSFGPRNTGPNILLNSVPSYSRPSIWSTLESGSRVLPPLQEYDNSIVSGFQLASLSGPLCEEPMLGVCFVVKEWSYSTPKGKEAGNSDSFDHEKKKVPRAEPVQPLAEVSGPFSGQLMSAMKEGCRRAFLARPSRLMAAMYSCEILATAEVLGKLYAVLGRRNGQVIAEEMKEGSAMFGIRALVPVAESFGFAEEIRKKTSGLASPQLVFSHWEVIPNDPFWVPSTEEELLHFGEKADQENLARRYMNAVRKRKGLRVEEKIVEHGEKQRTLKKNK